MATTKTKTTSKTASKTASKFNAKSVAAGDPYKPLPGVPAYDKTEYEKLSEQSAGQARALEIALQRSKNVATAYKVDEAEAKAANALDRAQNAWARRDVDSQTMAQKLAQSQNALAFTQRETGLLKEMSDVRTERMVATRDHEKTMLGIEREQFSAKVSSAKAQLRDYVEQTRPAIASYE